jgi:hypothetical protein
MNASMLLVCTMNMMVASYMRPMTRRVCDPPTPVWFAARSATPMSVRMVQCNICTVKVHPLCVPVWHRSDSIDFRKPQRAKDLFFVCMDCVRCLCCGARDAGAIDTARWRDSFRFCESCWQLQGALNFCSLCCLYYRADAENMVQCELCDFWIHSECDDISALKYDAMAHRDELYVCRLCRQRADYNKRLARVIKIKLLIAAAPEDDTADVQAALDDVDRQLFAPFQPVYVSDDDNEKANDDDDASDVDNGSKRGGRSPASQAAKCERQSLRCSCRRRRIGGRRHRRRAAVRRRRRFV